LDILGKLFWAVIVHVGLPVGSNNSDFNGGSVAILESMAGGQCWCKMSTTLDTDAILDF